MDFSMSEVFRCPVCKKYGHEYKSVTRFLLETLNYRFTCVRCGEFETSRDFVNYFFDTPESKENIEARAILSGIIRRSTDLHGSFRETITQENYKRIILSSGAPLSVDGQIDTLLRAIAERARFFGEFTESEPVESWVARAYLAEYENLSALIKELEQTSAPLIRKQGNSSGSFGPKAMYRFSLTLAGWERIREIKSIKGEGNQAFVAMWFHDKMYEVFDNAIAPALEAVGYKPYLVSRASNNNTIDDEIRAQIRKSKILIAEVTGERAGVYYEAGFAQGLGIPVIWCCNESWETRLPSDVEPITTNVPLVKSCKWPERMHFDTRQFPHIFWREEKDFKKQLSDRIQALGLDLEHV